RKQSSHVRLTHSGSLSKVQIKYTQNGLNGKWVTMKVIHDGINEPFTQYPLHFLVRCFVLPDGIVACVFRCLSYFLFMIDEKRLMIQQQGGDTMDITRWDGWMGCQLQMRWCKRNELLFFFRTRHHCIQIRHHITHGTSSESE